MNENVIRTRNLLNQWGRDREPFLLLADFELEQVEAWRICDIDPDIIRFEFNAQTSTPAIITSPTKTLEWSVDYPSPERYHKAFSVAQNGLKRGDSFLLNLTFPTKVQTNWSLHDIYEHTAARYKIWWKDQFVVFSPEIFVQIRDGKIFSHPMKGTLPGHLPVSMLLNDPKEKAEHATIVDLIRNDLSQVAQKVRVDKYRYVEQIPTATGGLWQTSSEISGELAADFHKNLGDLIFRLLPAGSVSGAPKAKTIEIIADAEGQKRGYYTGIAAYWNGYELDSCVLIRFLEKDTNDLRYWSGGGITAYSDQGEEYKELKEKVYLPVSTAIHTPFAVAETIE